MPCAMLRRQAARTDFWMTVGQEVEVTGRAEQFHGRYQLFVLEARLLKMVTSLAEVSASLEAALPELGEATPVKHWLARMLRYRLQILAGGWGNPFERLVGAKPAGKSGTKSI